MLKPTVLRCITTDHEVLNFTDDEGKKVHLERTKAYIFLPDATFPDVVFLMGIHPIGEGSIDLVISVKKEAIRARLDLESLKIKPEVKDTPPPLKS